MRNRQFNLPGHGTMSHLSWMKKVTTVCFASNNKDVLMGGGKVGRGRKRDQGTDRKGQMKGKSLRERERSASCLWRVETTGNRTAGCWATVNRNDSDDNTHTCSLPFLLCVLSDYTEQI